MYWSDSSGLIELNITKNQARSCSHSGRCDDDVAFLRKAPTIKRQLNKLNPENLVKCLREYGAWDTSELSDHDANLDRLLWVACCDIAEEIA